MDNIIIEKIYNDCELIELRISAVCEYVSAFQYAYVQKQNLESLSIGILHYSLNPNKECYFEFGNKKGNYTPAFSLTFYPSDKNGHVYIEVDMEINDNSDRRHRCQFYVRSAIGSVEIFAKRLMYLTTGPNGTIVNLHNN